MLSTVELAVISGFYPRPTQRLLPIINRSIPYPQEDIYACLKSLESRGIVDIVSIGGTTVFTLNVSCGEAYEGYVFYVRRMKEMFSARYPDTYEKFMKNIKRSCIDIYDAVLIGCSETLSGHMENGTSEPQTTARFHAYAILTRSQKDDDRTSEFIGCDGKQQRIDVKSSIAWREYTQEEFRAIKRTEPETFNKLIAHSFPVYGLKNYFEILYLEIGV